MKIMATAATLPLAHAEKPSGTPGNAIVSPLSTSDSSSSSASQAQKRKVLFKWTLEGDTVSLVGSWNGWVSRKEGKEKKGTLSGRTDVLCPHKRIHA